MYWNYRVVAHENEWGNTYQIHEAYYEGSSKVPAMLSENPIAPLGDTTEELEQDLELMSKALTMPVIYWKEWVKTLNNGRLAESG